MEHKEQNKDLSLWTFLYMHYATEDANSDPDHDRKLPFKSHSECSGSVIVTTIPPHYPDLMKPSYSEIKKFSAYNENDISAAFLSTIWQPPKYC
jgi:hypothetical protein